MFFRILFPASSLADSTPVESQFLEDIHSAGSDKLSVHIQRTQRINGLEKTGVFRDRASIPWS